MVTSHTSDACITANTMHYLSSNFCIQLVDSSNNLHVPLQVAALAPLALLLAFDGHCAFLGAVH